VLPPSDVAAVTASLMHISASLVIVSQNGTNMELDKAHCNVCVSLATKSHEDDSFEEFDAVTLAPQLLGGSFAIDGSGLRACSHVRMRVTIDALCPGEAAGSDADVFAVIRDVQFAPHGISAPPLGQQQGSVPLSNVLSRVLNDLDGDEAQLLSNVVFTRQTNASAWNKHRIVWNGLIDRFPAIIVLARNEDDVCRTVTIARELSLELTVKGGGHNVAGSAVADGALLLDLSLLNSISVDIEQSPPRISVGGGCTWAAVDAALYPHGMAVPAGTRHVGTLLRIPLLCSSASPHSPTHAPQASSATLAWAA
jgi:hypothetical protein